MKSPGRSVRTDRHPLDVRRLRHNTVLGGELTRGGKNWYFVTVDNAFGQQCRSLVAWIVRANGGTVLGSVGTVSANVDFRQVAAQASVRRRGDHSSMPGRI